MLRLEHFLGKGATRLCFYHPERPDKCVKVAMRYKNIPQLEHELQAVKACRPHLGSYLPDYDDELVKTNLGPGLVCEIIRNDDGSISENLANALTSGIAGTADIIPQIEEFSQLVLKHNIPLYDFNPENFVLQKKSGKTILRFTDLKTYNRYKPWTYLRTERLIPAISRQIVKRRLERLMKWVCRYSEKGA